jgi:Ni/Fe-hydrogenase subunit HybB-like protein
MALERAAGLDRIVMDALARQRWTFTGTLVYWVLVAFCGGVWSLAAAAWLYQIYFGLQVTGLLHPVMWATYIATFVFWIGIAHSGTLMSAILFLFRARWRIAIARLAETMTLAAIMTALLFPIIHLGRAWRAYWLIPYPNERGLWINFSSPLIWDAAAIGTYFVASILFWFIHLIPDFATLRDRERSDWRRLIYGWLACGWRGTAHEWAALRSAYAVLAGLIAVLVVSVHSIVSWDFAVAIVPGWHSTIFAPYFVAGAMFSGLAMLILLLVPGRELLRLEAKITADHLDKVARLITALSLILTYSYATEFAFAGRAPAEQAQFLFRVAGTYAPLFWVTIACNSILPLVFFSARARRNTNVLMLVSLAIVTGMWLERFVIVVASLAHEYSSYSWGTYRPTYVEATIAIGSLAWFLFWFLLIVGHIPPISIAEEAEEGRKAHDSEVIKALGIRTHVGLVAFIGGLVGALSGLWFTSWTAQQWPSLIVGGKPLLSWPTFFIIAFELTILAAVLATTAAFAVNVWRSRRLVQRQCAGPDAGALVARDKNEVP